MNRFKEFLKKETVFTVALVAALLSLLLSPLTAERFMALDWKTLASLFMLLLILCGFRKENMFLPLFRLTERIRRIRSLSLLLVFLVFVLAPFITNDVSLLTFVPLTFAIFRHAGKEQYSVKIAVLENIAAITGAFLTPFGNPQNLYIYANTEVSATSFILHMVPLWLVGAIGLYTGVSLVFRRDPGEEIVRMKKTEETPDPERKGIRLLYLALLMVVIFNIVTSAFTFIDIFIIVLALLLIFDRSVFLKVDYILLCTFFCFFLFSSSVASNPAINEFLFRHVAGREYFWGIGVSQIISNVPGAALLHRFSTNVTALLYGVNTAGMGTIVGSLASLITMRLYLKEYPGTLRSFLKHFHTYSLAFLAALFLIAMPLLNWAL